MRHPKRSIPREIRVRNPRHPREREELEALVWPEAAIRVKERMTHPAVTIRCDAFAGEAWKLMRSRKLRHLPVVDDSDRLVGILTDRDLRQVIFDPAIQEQLGNLPKALNLLTVKEVMTWGVITVSPEAEIRQAARLMHEHKIGALPVVEGDRVVGILTETDIVKTFVDVLGEGVVSKPYRWAFGW
jgi:acetoin utilization protein AcuB